MRVLLVDDHPMFAEGLVLLLQQNFPSLQCAHALSMAHARSLLDAERFDLILSDLNLPDSRSFATVASLREATPDTPCAVISSDDSPEVVSAAIDAGASAFVSKTANYAEMIKALSRLLAGAVVLPERALAALQTPGKAGEVQASQIGLLTARQRDVLRLLMQGQSNKLICRELDLSPATVKSHLAAIFRTLEVASRTEAVIVAARNGGVV